MGRRSPAEAIGIGLVLTGLVGTIDYLTGYELSFSIFYLGPIVLVTWYAPRAGFFFCGVSAVTWLLADYADGHNYSSRLIPLWNATVRLGFFLVTSLLLAELKRVLGRERLLARVDGLTGLFNARVFGESCRGLLLLAARHGHPAAIGYLDIDDFKALNDSSGHSEGDRVLRAVGSALGRAARDTDVVGRLGGDEFAVFLPETDIAGARIVFDRIRSELAQSGIPVGCSIGVAVFGSVPSSLEEVLNVADRLMYRVKKAGKGNLIYQEFAGSPVEPELPPAAEPRRA